MVHIFIINAHAGMEKFSAALRNHLSKRTDIKYYILHTRRHLDEIELVKQVLSLFEDEAIRIYSCGGSGTFRNILAGLEDPSGVEIAFFPKGFTNDFLKSFGEKRNLFDDIDNLIEGQAIPIDYIKTNHGPALNTFSLGLDTIQVQKMNEFRSMSVFGKNVPYFLGFIFAIFKSLPFELEVEIDNTKHTGRFQEIFFGNGGVIGGSLWFEKKTSITDGKGRIVLFRMMPTPKIIKNLMKLIKKDVDNIADCGYAGYTDHITVRRRDGVPFIVDLDGDLQPPQEEWQVSIVKGGLNFVVPKGVKIND